MTLKERRNILGLRPHKKGEFKHSEETKRKMSVDKKGRPSPRKGVKLTDKTKEKLRKSHLGQIAWNKGKKCPQLAGKNCSFWKGGNSKNYRTGYYSFDYKQWRMKVFERDKWICQFCGVHGSQEYLTAHHIKGWAHYPELRFELSNGITLCEECHKLTDNYKGRGRKK